MAFQRRVRQNVGEKTPLGSKLLKSYQFTHKRDPNEISTEVFLKELQFLRVEPDLARSWSNEVKTMEIARIMNMRFLAYTYYLMYVYGIKSRDFTSPTTLSDIFSKSETISNFITPWIPDTKTQAQKDIKIIKFKHEYIKYITVILNHRDEYSPIITEEQFQAINNDDEYGEDLRNEILSGEYDDEIQEQSDDYEDY